ncbi:unnamed protein product [Echinostoma caproni]|uniref:N-terminal Ras-GEF domain-containing protein n=1 Tax=Echinostoma caproni TaxID=27848 RepID=A0A183AEZ0_9TREM|nr:unnamed protein product [Echinostoma caproni]
MLSTSQSTPLEQNMSLPVDGRCIVVQMPSVEEMRREVADITCQMQSVYLDDEANLGSAEEFTHIGSRKCSTENSSLLGSPRKKMTTLGPKSSLLDRGPDTEQPDAGKAKSNTIGRVVGISNEMIEAFPIQSSMSSSLPREEQVSEEFVINGKRYRQTYQRRVVLERKTTRDVFFLPASSGDTKSTPSAEKTLEYHSPNFIKSGMGTVSPEPGQPDAPDEIDSRPRLDLTVLHNPSGTTSDTACLTPAVIMRPVTNSPEKAVVDPLRNGHKKSPEENGHANTPAHKLFLGVGDGSRCYSNTLSSETDSMRSEKPNRVKRSRSRYIVREMVEAVKKQVANNLRRTKSILTTREEEQFNKARQNRNTLTGQTERGSSVQCILSDGTEDGKKIENKGRHELVGYMYKFGVWDNQAPVLDPRLPVAIRSSVLSREGLNGTVIANPPEWHHAEVGLNESGSGLVRGRVVACLQRFTQHSSASGKALHRSTYVQQTRLVRQRNQDTHPGDASTDPVPANVETSNTEVKDPNEFGPDKQNGHVVNSASMDQIPIPPNETRYIKCSNDRLQLLQSLCPAAAAATILLGRQFSAKPASLSNSSDSESSGKEDMVNLGETRVMVSANSWCPQPLIAKDLSPYLVFTHADQISDSSQSTVSTVTHMVPLQTKGQPDSSPPVIRGGTLDGLIAYALRVLEDPTNAQNLNTLFPQVFRVTYPTFTTPERVIERLIQVYVAHAPMEPGCQSRDWSHALTAAEFLVTLVSYHPASCHSSNRLIQM